MSVFEVEGDPTGWLGEVTIAEADKPVKVVLEERSRHALLLRQVDPNEPEPPRIPLYDGDQLTVMTAISHIGLHSAAESTDLSDLLHSMRVVPVRRDGNVVFARTLRHGETDDGRRVHLRPGDSLTFEQGAVTAELMDIDGREEPTESGYVPLGPVLATWFSFGREHWDDNAVRYVLAAARRLDMANEMFIRVRAIEFEINSGELSGPQLRRKMFMIVGCVELAVISLGRAVAMTLRAPERLKVEVPMPASIVDASPAILAIRDAYEHIEERAFGTVRGSVSPVALSIFDYRTLFRDDLIVYGEHTLDVATQAQQLLTDCRETLRRWWPTPYPQIFRNEGLAVVAFLTSANSRVVALHMPGLPKSPRQREAASTPSCSAGSSPLEDMTPNKQIRHYLPL